MKLGTREEQYIVFVGVLLSGDAAERTHTMRRDIVDFWKGYINGNFERHVWVYECVCPRFRSCI